MKSLALSALLAAAAPAAAEQGRTFLLSIEGIEVAGQSVTDFRIASWDVDWIAICRIPAGWRLRAGRDATSDGLFEGESTHGATRLAGLEPLRNVALLRLRAPVQWRDRPLPDGVVPASLAGTLSLSGGRQVRLGRSNLRLGPAGACPRPAG
jgi:hypothetical protein